MASKSPLISAIILAAGRSGRMGSCKALLDLGGRSALNIICENLCIAGIKDQFIITGCHAAEIVSATPAAEHIYNPDHAHGGMISSIKTGLAAVHGKCNGVLIALVDHPLVSADTMREILDQSILHPNRIVRPRYDAKMGHPVVIPAVCVESILALPAEATLKTWMQQRTDQIIVADVNDAGILMDLDTPADYERAKAMLACPGV